MRSSLLVIGVLIFANILLFIPSVVQAPPQVNSISVATDRIDYIEGMTVNATVNVEYNGNYNNLPSWEIKIEWFYPNGTMFFNETKDFVDLGIAYSQWDSNYSWDNTLPFWINVTYVLDPAINGTTQFYLFFPEEHAIVTDVNISLAKTIFEIGDEVMATATLTYLGNQSLLQAVNFSWNYSDGVNMFNTSFDPTTTGGVAYSSWTSDVLGTNFYVNATYLGNDTITSSTTFDVMPRRVKTWHNVRITSDSVWLLSDCPYGINGIVTIDINAVLTIEPGCTVKFNYSSGFLVKGTLIVQGTLGQSIIFTSYQFSPARGDWEGIEFEDSGGSIIKHARLEYATMAIIANVSSPTIEDSLIRNSTQRGISLYYSQSIIKNNTISNIPEAIYIYDSSPVVIDNKINNSYVAIRATSISNATFINNTIEDNKYGMNISQSSNIAIESSIFINNSLRALNINTASSLTVSNSTFEINALDILLIAAEAQIINSSFEDSKVTVTPGSRLIVKNFLHIKVEDSDGTPIENATARIFSDGYLIFSDQTNDLGYIYWLVLTDRTFEGTSTPTKYHIVVNISEGDEYEVANNTRTVDMVVSHTEIFIVSLKGTPLPPPGWISSESLPWIIVLAFIACAALILSLFLMFKKRKSKRTTYKLKSLEKIGLKSGTTYLVDEEKPESTYKILKKELGRGAKGLCITRTHPDKAKALYFIDCSFLWLSRDEKGDSVNPTNLGGILKNAKSFMKNVDNGILVLDGLEYLLVQNGFNQSLKFIHLLNESVSTSSSKLLISFNLQSLDGSRRALLTSDLEVLS